MKKQLVAVICVVLAVWFFVMGFELGIYKERKDNASTTVPTIPAVSTTAPLTTAMPSTEPSVIESESEAESSAATTAASTTAAGSTAAGTTGAADPSSMSKEEIIAEMSKAFKTLKAEQNFTAVKDETVSIQLTDLSVKSLLDTVNNVIQGLAGSEKNTYTFSGGVGTGVDKDGKAIEGEFTVANVIPPQGEWSVDPAGVASATASKNGDVTTYEIKLSPEDTTFTSPVPKYGATVYGYLDLTALDIPLATITDANMHYEGTSCSISVDGSGKVTALHFNMPMNGYGEAKIGFISGNASFEGYDEESWVFTY